MIDMLKNKINNFKTEVSFENRNKTKKTIISKINPTEHTLKNDNVPCLLLQRLHLSQKYTVYAVIKKIIPFTQIGYPNHFYPFVRNCKFNAIFAENFLLRICEKFDYHIVRDFA
jgi:hypothetical protein